LDTSIAPTFGADPEATFIDDSLGRMRCTGERCVALVGDVGVETSCSIYANRPDVCRACQPGDEECQTARRHHNLA
jgi:Fe-S-cluster containining protein